MVEITQSMITFFTKKSKVLIKKEKSELLAATATALGHRGGRVICRQMFEDS